MGVWPSTGGKVRLDGVDVFQWNKDELGQHIGYLPQEVDLFDGTVAENIARFGDVDLVHIEEICKLIGIHEIIEKPYFLHIFIKWCLQHRAQKIIVVSKAVQSHWGIGTIVYNGIEALAISHKENYKSKFNIFFWIIFLFKSIRELISFKILILLYLFI